MSLLDMSVDIGGAKFKNPIMLASGTAGYGDELSQFFDLSRLGAIVTKSISLKPRIGNPPQRIFETHSGMLNSIGLANIGVEKFITEKLSFLKKLNVDVICNIAANTIEEYVECVNLLNAQEVIKAFEINISCPNVKEGGLEFGHDLKAVAEITDKTKAASKKPIIIKLSPNTPKISIFAKIVKENGGDAVTAINTLVGAAFDIHTRKPRLKNITGGLSGPAIKPVAIAKVLEIKRNLDIPIIGVGGIMEWKDVVEFMIAGASAVQLGTVNFLNPFAAIEIIDALKKYCNEKGVQKISELTGSFDLQ